MKILDITLTVQDLPASVEFYRRILGMAIYETTDRAVVQAGSSRMTLIPGERFDGVHHVAFGIVPSEFELAHAWLSERVVLLVDDGSEVIIGSPEWDSRSLYFLGPENIVLEFIARGADADQTPGNGESPRILSISEIGIGVPDVSATVRWLSRELALPPFFSQGESFAPVGDHDGLLIVVQQDRIWFPTQSLRAARGPLEVRLEAPTANAPVNVTPAISIATARSVP
ncbi:hypothetical protein BA895_17405 [Humibacillus sp. DSM 29435]|uniref:VOC family protein n=1 Tax=Humibacillus sp. DSM 29435 TaxID=1869167 RepID=UPI0008730D07|nr:VOC family protein [Humibacillus sp. DSM 29435]OFE17224.1 hypothetical protein BA895_17405 [Humibacillus sp. DSM 29435]